MAVFFSESGRFSEILMLDIQTYNRVGPVQKIWHDNSDSLTAARWSYYYAMRWRIADQVFSFVFPQNESFAREQACVVDLLPGRPVCVAKFRFSFYKEADDHAGHKDMRDSQGDQETGFYARVMKIRQV